MAQGVARFRQAINAARTLHPDLLSQSQKLRLYALFRQSQGSAPDEPPEENTQVVNHHLARAKWEAWRDVRELTQAQAMDSYSEIIEGLVAMMSALDDGGDAEEMPRSDSAVPGTQSEREAIEQMKRAQLALAQEEDDDDEDDDDDDAEDDDGDDEDEDDDDDETEPTVTQTVWSTNSISVAPGGTFAVPLAFDAPCRCSYSYSIVTGSTGPIGFSVSGPEKATLLSEYKSEGEGRLEVTLPPALKGKAAVLTVTLDNTASTFSAIEVKVHVCLEPLGELKELENFKSRVASASSLPALILRPRRLGRPHCLFTLARAHPDTWPRSSPVVQCGGSSCASSPPWRHTRGRTPRSAARRRSCRAACPSCASSSRAWRPRSRSSTSSSSKGRRWPRSCRRRFMSSSASSMMPRSAVNHWWHAK